MSITTILKNKGIPFKIAGDHHHVTNGWLGLDCPYCDNESEKFHLGFNLKGKYFSCWRCGPLPTSKVLPEILGIPLKHCWRLLKEMGGEETLPSQQHKAAGKLTLPKGLGPLLPAHRNYLHSRGYKVKYLEKLWQIQGIGPAPPYSWRVFIPIHYQGKAISWTTRSISNQVKLRYKNAPVSCEAISAKELLYGMDYCRMAILVVEGALDVWSIGPGAAATMGIGYSQKQLFKIGKFPLRLVCFDNEVEAQKRARKLCRDLEPLPGKTVNVVLDAKDPGSASDKEVKSLRRLLEKGP